ncbi:hypothetical protein Tco_0861532 [Tanacetum coccineum]|uniref:Uncharacterized protein n=1 Tax=Tanacetum coccineum TaxID=301880 RepID=A0ABQ5BI30_9ASTR
MSLHVPQEGSKEWDDQRWVERVMEYQIGHQSIKEEEVPLVDGVFEGALGALALEMEALVDAMVDFPKPVQAFWVRIAEASPFDVRIEDHHFVQKKWEHHIVGNREVRESLGKWSGKVDMIWSFSVLGVCKSTKILFVCKYGLTSEWDSEDLTELLERESDEFVLNHEGDKNDAGFILLKSDLTIKV